MSYRETGSRRCLFAGKIAMSVLLILLLFCGCAKGEKGEPTATASSDIARTNGPSANTDAEPKTLEQALLKQRGKAFDQSDYQKISGGEGIIDINTKFDCTVDHGDSKNIDCLVLSAGKIYRANFNSLLSNGKNIQEIGTLPSSAPVLYWRLTYDGEMGNVYFKDGTGYKLNSQNASGPYTSELLDSAQYPLFKKVYRYAADGVSLEDCTSEYLNADTVYDNGSPMLAFAGKKVSMIFSGQYLDEKESDWNWYRDMGWREYIAFDLDLSAIGNETPVRLFNSNILMTDKAFYEIVYASKPLDAKEEAAQLAPNGSVSPYYPAANHLNCNLTLRKIELLTKYYNDVRNICTSHVITNDYTLLPINEVITEGYPEYFQYDCIGFWWDYSKE